MDIHAWPLRRASAQDVEALAALYREAALVQGPQVYSPAQVRAWASFGQPSPAFVDYVTGADTWVALDGPQIVGFSGVDAQGEVRSLYVRPSHGRRGLGARLLAHALASSARGGLTSWSAWATPFSRPVFERAGFALAEVRREPYQGIEFDRYRMIKPA